LPAPETRRRDGDLLELALHRRLEAQIFGERPLHLRRFGAAQVDVERAVGAGIAALGDLLVDVGLLLRIELRIGRRLEATAAQVQFRRRRGHYGGGPDQRADRARNKQLGKHGTSSLVSGKEPIPCGLIVPEGNSSAKFIGVDRKSVV
jgi:hypothetical protein